MTLNEWNAFLEGVGIEGAPTEAQWRRIREKVERELGKAPQPVIVVNPPCPPWWPSGPYGPITCDPLPKLPDVTCLNPGTSSAADPH